MHLSKPKKYAVLLRKYKIKHKFSEKNMIIQRKKYLDMLISGEGNNLVKIVTGVRRCGKSFLLFKLFRNYLTEKGVDEQHIIELS